MRMWWVLAMVACGGRQPPVDPVPEPAPVEAPAPMTPPAAGCAAMRPADCFHSPDCILGADGACRDPLDACERGFVQADLSTCACHLAESPCFCPPDVVCVCGGGLPPMCVSAP